MNAILITLFSCFLTIVASNSNLFSKFDRYKLLDNSELAKIELEKLEGKINVKGIYYGELLPGLTYKLNIQKMGKSGSSNNAQSGKIEKETGQNKVVLSSSGFNVQPGDKFFIQLQIFQDAILISQETLEYLAP